MGTIQDRLRERLNREELSVRAFQKAVEALGDEDARGVSYASVHDYVERGADPPLSFLRLAADVLGVRLAWLVDEDGAPTKEEQLLWTKDRNGADRAWIARDLFRLLKPLTPTSEEARDATLSLWSELLNGADPTDEVFRQGQAFQLRGQKVAELVVALLDAPLQAIGHQPESEDEINAYLIHISTGFSNYLRALRRLSTGTERADREVKGTEG